MATLKITLFFEGRGKGWTESYWRPGAGGDHDAQLAVTRSLCALRAQLLGRECRIKAYRISTEGTGPDALLKYEEFKPKGDLDNAGMEKEFTITSAQPDVGLLVRCSNLGYTKHKFVFLRGIWDVVEDEHGLYKPNNKWKAAFQKYKDQIEVGDWGWFGVATKTKERLVSAVRDAKDQVTFTFVGNVFPLNLVGKRTRVRISGVNNGKSSLNRTHVVEVISQTSAKTEFTTAVGNLIVGGFGAHQLLDFVDIKNVEDQKIITRECGAPLLESPGRQKARNRA